MCLDIEILQMFSLKLKKMGNFHALEVVCRCSETQLQVDENLDCLIVLFC